MIGEKSARRLTKVPHFLGLGLGLGILAGTVVLAAILPSKELAIAVAITGTFLGTALLTWSLSKLVSRTQGEQTPRDLSRSEVRGRLQAAEQGRQAAELQAREAAREIARLESMRINVAAFRPILNLGLLEVETHITDFQRRIIGDAKEEVWWRNGYRQAYVGVVRIPVKAHLGVDLQQVRVREAAGNRLILVGLRMVTVTDTAQGATWLVDEIRTEYLKDRQAVKFKGDARDPRAKEFSREQELQVRARLKQGQDFKVFEAGLLRAAEQLLRVLLAPLQKEIAFESDPSPESQELLAYLGTHNRELESRLAARLKD